MEITRRAARDQEALSVAMALAGHLGLPVSQPRALHTGANVIAGPGGLQENTTQRLARRRESFWPALLACYGGGRTTQAMQAMRAVLISAGCAVLLAACGGSHDPGSRQTAFAQGLKFSQCMRAHGLTNFPDPSAGGGIQLNSSSGLNPSSPGFQAAQNACAKDMPGLGKGGQASEAQKQQMLKMSECMRAHGLTSFPDPTSKAPSPSSLGGLGMAFGRSGSFIVIPQSIISSPAFNQAAAACGLPGAGRPPGNGHAKLQKSIAP